MEIQGTGQASQTQTQMQMRKMDGSGGGQGQGGQMKDIMQSLSPEDRSAVQDQMSSLSQEDRQAAVSQMQEVDSTSMSSEDYVSTLLDILTPTEDDSSSYSIPEYA